MSKGGGGAQQTAENKPWSQQQRDALIAGYEQLVPQILNRPTNYYPGSTVAPQSGQTQAGIQGLTSAALQSGLQPWMQQTARGALSTGLDPGRSQAVQNVIRTGLETQTPYALRSTVAGNYLDANNYLDDALRPAFRQAQQTYQTATAPGTDSAFARSGRFGSGAHQNLAQQQREDFARAMTETGGQLAYQNYGDERNRQMQGIGLATGLEEAAANRQMQGIGMDQDRINSAAARQMQALGMAPGLDASRFMPAQQMLQAGQLQDQYAQRLLGDDAARWDFYQNEPLNRLNNFFGIANNQTGSHQTQSGPGGGSDIAGILGGAAGGAGLGSLLSGGLAGWTGVGAGAGALLPLLMSDRRVKTDIRRVGETDGGHAVYLFRYKGHPTVHMGVMAQEVRERQPGAVVERSDGMLAVDYGQLS